jgi:electron transport complex protein RnfG
MTHPPKDPTAVSMAVRTAVILFVFVIVFTGLLSGAYLWTRPAIEASAEEERMKLIDDVLPRGAYDNNLLRDTVRIPPSPLLGLEEASTVYRARRGNEIVALVLEATAPDGYSGKIRLLLAVGADGTLSGVRVTQHRETPGLGDYIEPKKDKNKARPWITQFNGLSLATVGEREWRVKKDGGRFDSMAGATVTPRAVVKAVHKTLTYVEQERVRLFAPPEGSRP